MSYEYTLEERTDGNVFDSVAVEVRDILGDGGVRALNIAIVDDAPILMVDAAAITEDAVPSTVAGNVLTNDIVGADADAMPVTGVSFAGASGTLGNALAGQYGSLTLTPMGVIAMRWITRTRR